MPDTIGFIEALDGLPEQLAAAHEAAAGIDVAPLGDAEGIDNIVVLGMGSSGIVGDALAAVSSGTLPVPVVVLKQYRTPAFIGPRTLVFAVSYSGDTEETLAMTAGARDAGAKIVTVSRGGALPKLGDVHFPCDPTVPVPRASMGTTVAPLFVTLFRLGLLPDAHQWLVKAEAQLVARREKCRPDVAAPTNPAREIARKVGTTFPIFYGGGALGQVAAMRWKFDVNENAKAPAFWNAYPEIDHHEICGWGQHGDVTRQLFTLVELRHGFEHERLAPRFAATRDIIEETLVQVLEVRAAGDGRLAQLLDLMYLSGWASTYLALDHDVDPGPIEAISQLKARMAQAG